MSRATWLTIGLVAVVVCMRIGLFGQDINWDLRNYHYYGAWALLNGVSFDHNIWPSQVQTYLNPLPYVPAFLAIELLGPRIATLLLSAFQALNILLLVLLARLTLLPLIANSDAHRWAPRAMVASAVVIGVTTSVFLGQIGTTLADVTTSTLILGGLILLIASRGRSRSVLLIGLAGIAIGAATGLKLTNGVYVLGALATPWWLGMNRRDAVRGTVVFAVAILIGLLLTHGYWSWLLFERYGSPMYPFYNTVFQSPWFPDYNVGDDRYPAKSLFRGLSYAFRWAIGDFPQGEQVMDGRFAVVIVLIAAGVAVGLWRVRSQLRAIHIPPKYVPLLMLVPFFVASYVPWVFVFGVARYVVGLELISGVLIVGLLTLLAGRSQAHVIAVLAGVGLLLFTTPLFWGRSSFGDDWFGVRVPQSRMAANEMFVMVGELPTAYMIPSFPRDSRFVRVDSYLGEEVLDSNMPVGTQIVSTISSHAGPIYSFGDTRTLEARQRLAEFGLAVVPGSCVYVSSRTDRIQSCALEKV